MKNKLGVAICTVALTFCLAHQASAQQKSLYQRLGGYDAISAVVDDFAGRLFSDSKLDGFFGHMGADTRKMFRQKNKNLVCNVTGGPCEVISRPAKQAHEGLGVGEKEFNIVVDHLVASLNEFNVPKGEQEEVLEIIGTLKKDIVEK